MLMHPMLEQLKSLKLSGMVEVLNEQLQDKTIRELSFEERLGFMVERESTLRENKKLNRRLSKANLKFTQAAIADIDYRAERKLDKHLIATLATGDWIKTHSNFLITGATGTGKSWLSNALAHKACLLGYSAKYWRVSNLLEELALSKADGRYSKLIKALAKVDLLILDDWAMVKLQQGHQQGMFDLLDDRYQQKSTLVLSQVPVDHWYEQIANSTFADAIIDRMLSDSYRLELKGPSLRAGRQVQNITQDERSINDAQGEHSTNNTNETKGGEIK